MYDKDPDATNNIRPNNKQDVAYNILNAQSSDTTPPYSYIDPSPVKTGFLVKNPQCRADACGYLRDNNCRYPITLPYVEYDCKNSVPDDAPCTEFLQEP